MSTTDKTKMENQPLVSIIVPTYNVERYVEECIDSLLNQTYKPIEIIVLDDGSTDATVYLLEKYGTQIQLIANSNNKGQGARRNEGMTLARGKYIYFVDSDDWIEHNTIEETVKQLEETQSDIVRFNGKAFYQGNLSLVKEGRYDFSQVLTDGNIYKGDELFEKTRKSYSASPCLYVFKKSLIEKHALHFLEGVLHEDEYFTTRLFVVIESMTYINKAYYNRRYRTDSTMTNQSNIQKLKSFESYLTVYKELETYYSTAELSKSRQKFLKRQLLSIYNGLLVADIHPEKKKQLKKLDGVTLMDRIYLMGVRVKHTMTK